MPIARAAALPKRLRKNNAPGQISLLPEEDGNDEPAGFHLDDAVFREFSQFHVPTLRKLLEVTRESPQIQDYMIFLQWRSFSAKEESLIPWAQMREQDDADEGAIGSRADVGTASGDRAACGTTNLQPNVVRWEAVDAIPGQAAVSPSELLAASLRHRPDRIVMGEIRNERDTTCCRP